MTAASDVVAWCWLLKGDLGLLVVVVGIDGVLLFLLYIYLFIIIIIFYYLFIIIIFNIIIIKYI